MDHDELSEQVNSALGGLASAKIDDLNIDVAHKKITIQASSLWSSGMRRNTVIFDGVASFYAVLGAKERRFDSPSADRFPGDTFVGECDDASYFPEDVDGVHFRATPGTFVSKWAADFDTHPNFLISIGDYILLIEASQVRVDDSVFEVGYVRDTKSEGQ